MTIQGLNEFIRKKYSKAIEKRWLSTLKNNRIFIDANNILYHYISSANKRAVQNTDFTFEELDRSNILNMFMKSMIVFCLDFLKLDIVPILIFDGKAPESKSKTRQKRISKKQELQNKITENKTKIANLDVLSISQADIETHKKLLLQDNYITREEIAYFKIILNGIGIPVIEADCESEKLCSSLCIEGKGIAVYSQDSDCLAHGNPFTIRDLGAKIYRPELRIHDREVTIIRIDKLLEVMDLSYSQFLDVCITSGTDHNNNIPNLGVGKMYKMIKETGCIENCNVDFTPTDYKSMRILFSYQRSEEIILSARFDLPKEIPSTLRSTLESIDCLSLYSDLVKEIERFKNIEILERGFSLLPDRKKAEFIIVDE